MSSHSRSCRAAFLHWICALQRVGLLAQTQSGLWLQQGCLEQVPLLSNAACFPLEDAALMGILLGSDKWGDNVNITKRFPWQKKPMSLLEKSKTLRFTCLFFPAFANVPVHILMTFPLAHKPSRLGGLSAGGRQSLQCAKHFLK